MQRWVGRKREEWLSNQISAARRNLSEWPTWMKEAGRFSADKAPGEGRIRGASPSQRVRRPK